MSTKYNEEAEDLMFELFDEDDFTKVISFVDKYGCDFVDRDGRNLFLSSTYKCNFLGADNKQ